MQIVYLQAPLNSFIKLWFEPWIGLLQNNGQTCFHWVEIRHKKSHITRGLRYESFVFDKLLFS